MRVSRRVQRTMTVVMGGVVLIGSVACGAHGADDASWQGLVARHCPQRGVLPAMAQAVIAVESDGHAYALGVSIGQQHRAFYPASRAQAAVLLEAVLRHTDNVDIGLMQINWMTWGAVLDVEPAALLDAETSIRLGCRLLGVHLTGSGPLWQRLGRYHSGNRRRQQRYARQVLRAWLHALEKETS
jgi:soluble lytic murein transglycosylase-like protein